MTYTETGNPSSPTLLLLSGWAQDYRLFKKIVPLLKNDFHVVCINWRGHDEAKTVIRDFSSHDLTLDLLAFVQRLDIGSFYMASTSHGCWANISLCESLSPFLSKTIIIDWLLQPNHQFWELLVEGQDPKNCAASREKFFDEWAAATDCYDVIEHLRTEMLSFNDAMWMRACREIFNNYEKWDSPLNRMERLAVKPQVCHIYSQPLYQGYHELQKEFATKNSWFHPCHIPGDTHFPTLENPVRVSNEIRNFLL